MQSRTQPPENGIASLAYDPVVYAGLPAQVQQ